MALILAAGVSAFSQQKEYRTIFDDRDVRISGMGGPLKQITSVAGEFGHMMGGGAVMLNDFSLEDMVLGLPRPFPTS